MKIGIIGAGSIGGTLARRLAGLGHDVRVANRRGPLAYRAGGRNRCRRRFGDGRGARCRPGRVGDPAECTCRVSGRPVRGMPARVPVVDTSNYYPRQRDGRIEAIEAGLPESRWVEQQIGRPVIKAFNNIYAKPPDGDRRAVPVRCGASPCRWRATMPRRRRW